MSFQFMSAVTVHSDFKAKKTKMWIPTHYDVSSSLIIKVQPSLMDSNV